jgi:hypothetical protein
MSVETEDVPFIRDVRTKKLVINSAKQFFNPPPTTKKKVTSYSVSRRERGNPLAKAKLYSNTVNSDTWYGNPPGTILMESITCNYDGEAWSDVTYNFKADQEGWQTLLLDTGYDELKDGKLRKILSDDGTPVSEPAKLDGEGLSLTNQNQNGYDIGPFWKYEQKPFSALVLPNPFTLVTRTGDEDEEEEE